MRTLRTSLLLLLVVLALVVARGAHSASTRTARSVEAELVDTIRHYRSTTRRLQHVMGMERELVVWRGHPSLRRSAVLWRQRVRRVKRRFLAGPPHSSAWQCIHSYEGSWRDSGGPYYGGLQMDYS